MGRGIKTANGNLRTARPISGERVISTPAVSTACVTHSPPTATGDGRGVTGVAWAFMIGGDPDATGTASAAGRPRSGV